MYRLRTWLREQGGQPGLCVWAVLARHIFRWVNVAEAVYFMPRNLDDTWQCIHKLEGLPCPSHRCLHQGCFVAWYQGAWG
ncbi:hypothetical protein OEZ86_004016 [Tetradesmus obliquus]|nr:hypothetical protein OEZ86_004016 [Tetradesmus obliquus]